jgi:hypothetical protein
MKNYCRSIVVLVAGFAIFFAGGLQTGHAQIISTAPVTIVNWATHQVLDLPSGIVDRPVALQQYIPNGGLNQLWFLGCPLQSGSGGWQLAFCGQFPIMPIVAALSVYNTTPMALDVPNGSTVSGTPIQTYFYHGGVNQQWLLIKAGLSGTVFKIQNVATGKFLEVPAPYTQGTRVIQSDDSSRPTQLWYFIPYREGR